MRAFKRLATKISVAKSRASWKVFNSLKKIYTKTFARYILHSTPEQTLSFEEVIRLGSDEVDLSISYNYFLLHASYGDKWCILSLWLEHLQRYNKSKLIACHKDRNLIRIFTGEKDESERIIFVSEDQLNNLSGLFSPCSTLSMPVANSWFTEGCKHVATSFLLERGFPLGSIRHLHIVKYPYFNELYNLHGVSYGKLLRALLYLPGEAKATQPRHYTSDDHDEALNITKAGLRVSLDTEMPLALYNMVNFSHASLSDAQISAVISTLERRGYRVLLNATQVDCDMRLHSILEEHPNTRIITIPGHLLALVCSNTDIVVGVLGGAMNVAVQFSSAHVLSLQTPAVGTGCPDDRLYGEWGKERIWQWVDLDWPCLKPGRFVANKYIGEPGGVSCQSLEEIIETFLVELPISQ